MYLQKKNTMEDLTPRNCTERAAISIPSKTTNPMANQNKTKKSQEISLWFLIRESCKSLKDIHGYNLSKAKQEYHCII